MLPGRDPPARCHVQAVHVAAAQNAAAEAKEVASSFGAFFGPILDSGAYQRLRDVLTSAGRLDPKQEMQVSVELILDGAAARIAAAT